jgi:F-type H+-transporting ATPase subunit c
VFKRITIIGIALVESAAIYWLLIAILILYSNGIEWWQAIAAWLAVWLPGMAAWLGEWLVVQNAIKAILRNPAAESKIFNNMILFVALVESAAIYWLLIAILTIYK